MPYNRDEEIQLQKNDLMKYKEDLQKTEDKYLLLKNRVKHVSIEICKYQVKRVFKVWPAIEVQVN